MSVSSDLQQKPVAQFLHAIEQKGIMPPEEIIADGERHYFLSDPRKHSKAGWYIYDDDDIPHGSFGDYRTKLYVKSWVADLGRSLTEEERKALEQNRTNRKSTRNKNKDQRNAEARTKSLQILTSATIADDTHPYLAKKNVQAHGIRAWNNPRITIQHNDKTGKDYLKLVSPNGKVDISFAVDLEERTADKIVQDWQSTLVIPRFDQNGDLQTVQLISKGGEKKFLSGGKTQGCFFTVGKPTTSDTIFIAEGYATAATIYEATGVPTIAAFSAGNLKETAKAIRASYPDARIILCADDDYQTKGNPGLTDAGAAAEAVDGSLFVPEFGPDRPEGATDFNDMAALLGKEAVARYFSNKFAQGIHPMSQPSDANAVEIDTASEVSFSNPDAKPDAALKAEGEIITGTITKYGKAPYKFDKTKDSNFYIELQSGELTRTLWGVDLERSLAESGLHEGDEAAIYALGKKTVEKLVNIRDQDGKIIRQERKTVMKGEWRILPFEETMEEVIDNRPTQPQTQPKQAPTATEHRPVIQNHFPPEEFSEIYEIWKGVSRQSSSHDPNGYYIHLSDSRKITVTRDKVTIDKSLLHRPPDESYVSACVQARQFWDGRMEVNGDIKHRMRAMAYATVYGVEITNYTPTSGEQADIEQMVEQIRNKMEPSFGRPSTKGPAANPKPTP